MVACTAVAAHLGRRAVGLCSALEALCKRVLPQRCTFAEQGDSSHSGCDLVASTAVAAHLGRGAGGLHSALEALCERVLLQRGTVQLAEAWVEVIAPLIRPCAPNGSVRPEQGRSRVISKRGLTGTG